MLNQYLPFFFVVRVLQCKYILLVVTSSSQEERTLHKRRLGLSLTVLMLLTVVLGVLPAAPVRAAGETGMTRAAAVQSLQNYGVIDKKPIADLRLEDPITRAEVAKVLGAALKLTDAAAAKVTSVPFPDTAGHWAAGWIAVAKERGLFLGGSDGLFHPQDPVTYAEILTVLVRLTGREQEAATGWPWGAIATAAELGMVPPDLALSGRMDDSAVRGDVFWLTAIAIGRIPKAGDQRTVLQILQDEDPPVLDLSGFPAVTNQSTVAVSGRAGDAVSVRVQDREAFLTGAGTFQASLSLRNGTNDVAVVAVDGAGNKAEALVRIVYESSAALEIQPARVETTVGQSFTPAVLRRDAAGNRTPAGNVRWAYDTGGLARDSATGAFQALRPGEYTLRAFTGDMEATVSVIVSGPPTRLELQVPFPTMVAGGPPASVTVRVLDDQGRLNTADRSITLRMVPENAATLDSPQINTIGGQGTAYVTPGAVPGSFGLQAVLNTDQGTELLSPLIPIAVETRRLSKVELEATPAFLEPGAGRPVTIVATAVDQMGTPYPVREDLRVPLSTGNGAVLSLDRPVAVIPAGNSTSDAGGQNGHGTTGGTLGEVTVTGSSGSLSVSAAKVTVQSSGAMAQLKVTVLQEAAPADNLSAAVVSVARVDAQGKVVARDSTPVVLLSSNQGTSVTPLQTAGGVTTFAVRSQTPGRVTLVAGVPGRPALNSAPVSVAFIASNSAVRPVIRTAVNTVTAGQATTVYVALEDYSGGAGINPGPALTFRLQATGGTLAPNEAVIPSGATRSQDIVLNVPSTANMITISGGLDGGSPLNPAQLSVTPPQVVTPGPAPAGLNFSTKATTSGRPPVAGEEVRWVVQARDGETLLEDDDYAFKLQIQVNGQLLPEIPSGMYVTVGSRLIDLDDTLRTTKGEADVWVRYTGTGTVELTPVPSEAETAYDRWGVEGTGYSSIGFQAFSDHVVYSAGPLQRLAVQVFPNLGDPMQGVIKAAAGRFATVRLTPVDSFGNAAGSNCVASLTRVRETAPGILAIRSTAGDVADSTATIGPSGYAEFMVAELTDREGEAQWAPRVVCGGTALTVSQNVTVRATVHSAPTPEIEFAGGDRTWRTEVRGEDTGLQIRIARMASGPDVAELLVFEDGRMIGRFGPVYPQSSDSAKRTVIIPKQLLGSPYSTLTLRVRIHSGSDVSEESDPEYVYFTNQD